MQNQDRVLLGPTPLDVDALLAIDAGDRDLTIVEAYELRTKGWIDPNCEVPLITLEGRVLLDGIMQGAGSKAATPRSGRP